MTCLKIQMLHLSKIMQRSTCGDKPSAKQQDSIRRQTCTAQHRAICRQDHSLSIRRTSGRLEKPILGRKKNTGLFLAVGSWKDDFLCCGTTENTTESADHYSKYSGERFQWSGGMAGRPPTPKNTPFFFGEIKQKSTTLFHHW